MYVCICGNTYKGTSEDTLIAEGELKSDNTSEKFQDFIYNASLDEAGNKVSTKCMVCNLDFMTALFINNETYYTCICGYKGKKTDYDKLAK